MKKILAFIFTALLFASFQPLMAQGCDEPDSEGSDDEGKPKIFGFLQPQYEYHLGTDAENTFKFKRARIGLTGQIPYDFSYYIVMENSTFVSATGNPYLLDAFITYKRFKNAKISVGSFKVPFGQEVNTACSGLHTINRASVSDQIVSPQRDMGIMVLGGTNSTLVKYAVAITNGRGLGIKDNNNKKDILGRITVKPLEMLRVGGSFRYGYPNRDEPLADERITRLSLAGEFEVKTGNFMLQGEYIYDEGDYNRAAGGGCGADPLSLGEKRDGAYVQAMYLINYKIQPIVKYDYFTFDKDADNATLSAITVGANYFFNDATRFQLNYILNDGPGHTDDAIMMQLQVKF